jgi:ParB family transcriptional regulator, chromosome partitioning protein
VLIGITKMENIIENNQVVEITKLVPNKYNPKLDYNSTPELQSEFERIKKSIVAHGQIDPIIVREVENSFEIINGFHRFNAMKDLGYEKVEIKNLGKISLNEAISKTLSLEKTGLKMDTILEAKLIKEFRDAEGELDKLPYSDEEMKELIGMLEFDFDKFENQSNEPVEKRKVTCPECGAIFEL